MLEKNLKQYAKYFKDYTELRLQENRVVDLTVVNGSLTSNMDKCMGGISARAYKSGSWGFASVPEYNDESIRYALQTATDNAELLDSLQKLARPPLPVAPVTAHNEFKITRPRRTRKEIIDFLMEIDSYIATKHKRISSRSLRFLEYAIEKSMIASDSRESYSLIPGSSMYLDISSEKDGKSVTLEAILGTCGWMEDVFVKSQDIFPVIDERCETLLKKLEGVFPDAGMKDCILSEELASMLAHEAIGHVLESDSVAGGSIANGMLQEPVASPLITMVDFANAYKGVNCPAPMYVDDEGTPAEDAPLIENGILKSYLHNKESALQYGVRPMGNARAADFSDEPIVRMRNTAILPGKDTLEEMIASVDDGYYLVSTGNGFADLNSEFVFGVLAGYEIKKGKLGRPMKDASMSGNGLAVLKSVSMVSNSMRWFGGWFCGKRQSIPVGAGGPVIKCKLHVGGR